jgi:hypothetical protein
MLEVVEIAGMPHFARHGMAVVAVMDSRNPPRNNGLRLPC